MNLLEQYNDFVAAAEIVSQSETFKSTSIVGSIFSYSDSLKNASYLSMIEGNHLLNVENLGNMIKVLITSCLVFNLRLKKYEILNEFEITDNDSFDIDNLFEVLGKISYDIFENVLENKEGLNNDLINYLIKYHCYFNPDIVK